MDKGQYLSSINGDAKLELREDCRLAVRYRGRIRWTSPDLKVAKCQAALTSDGRFVLQTEDCDYLLASPKLSSADAIYFQLLVTNSGQLEVQMTTLEASLKLSLIHI
eukprot:TRINITY_DN13798_c0_g1_i1.p1 TRINITY_DN13798_c0_g1~~TRINITY_DN13798_c0_g1_i1.p1  ORF type:complete len:107 (-),score=16.80 TRINITY_DN13798_c0_g1_i1:12-332(-)